jgi:NitT/TauT family transport system permease protein
LRSLSASFDRWLSRGAVSARHGRHLRAVRMRRLGVVGLQAAMLVGVFGAWELAAALRVIDPFITSRPTAMARTLVDLFAQGSLLSHIGLTLFEAVLGFVLGTAGGVAIAAVMWWKPFVSEVLDPYLVILNATPKIALGPLFIIVLGVSVNAFVALTVSITLFITVLNVYSGFAGVDPGKLTGAAAFGASRWQQLRKVVLPAAMPTLVATLKVNVGLALIGAIVGEFLGARAGLGYLIIYGQTIFSMALVMTSVVLLTGLAAAMYAAVYLIERRLLGGRRR